MNYNTKAYWESRFISGDWQKKGGPRQTKYFAMSQVLYFKISFRFEGTILDFGCGLGDALPIYRKAFPKAKLIGIDVSSHAIDICCKKFGNIATFICGDQTRVPGVDVIIASNVFEHLTDDIEIGRYLLNKCADLYVTVPYKECPLFDEHIRSYDEHYFSSLTPYEWRTFSCRGWSQYGKDLWYHLYFKNIFRLILGKQVIKRRKQITFQFKGKTRSY